MLDARNRRLRWREPTPPVSKRTKELKRYVESDADLLVFRALHRHGPLPTHYLQEFVGGHPRALQYRLSDLYDWGYLVRFHFDPKLTSTRPVFGTPIIHDLGQKALDYLGVQPYRTDPSVHRLMCACVTASIELTHDTFIHRTEILEKQRSTFDLPLSRTAPREMLVPDELFALKKDNRIKFFAVEIDRNTESIRRKKAGNNTFRDKLLCYLDVFRTKAYHDCWGIRNLQLLTVTTNETHANNLENEVKELDPDLAHKFIFKVATDFGPNWAVPKELLKIDGLI